MKFTNKKLFGNFMTCRSLAEHLDYSLPLSNSLMLTGRSIACAVGTGPIDSAYKAVDLIVKEGAILMDYGVLHERCHRRDH
ncbi:unnamed protein product [Linum trigynum]|uniref:Uncharacterized protein n=1 Tax=Linum trigynum TaxID=586398 RepID=A0AAV2DU70_9ROSI